MIFHEIEHWLDASAGLHLPWVVQAALFAGFLLLASGLLVRARVTGPRGGVMPDEGVSVRNILEVLVAWLASMAKERMGPNWRRYFPLIGTLFFFILFSNVIGLVPGFLGATADVNMTAACAVIVWVFYTAIGIATHGWKYVLKFTGPGLFDMNLFGRHIHVRLLAPKTGQLLREHLRAPRGWHRLHDDDRPARTPSSTVALLARATSAGPSISAVCTYIHQHEGAAGVRRMLGVLALAKKHGPAVVDEAAKTALELGVPTYRFLRRYLERQPALPLTLRQVDPLIRQLTLYRDLIDRKTGDPL
jgi:hypothetical protein